MPANPEDITITDINPSEEEGWFDVSYSYKGSDRVVNVMEKVVKESTAEQLTKYLAERHISVPDKVTDMMEAHETLEEEFKKEGRDVENLEVTSWTDEYSIFEFKIEGEEWAGAVNEDVAEQRAIDQVMDTIEHDPEVFSPGFLEGYLDEDRFWTDMSSDISNGVYDSPESYTSFMTEEEPQGEDEEFTEEQIEEAVEGYMDDLKSGGAIAWLKEMGYEGTALGDYIRPYVDERAAAEGAVSSDGWAHHLSTYDGDYQEASNGLIYWRN